MLADHADLTREHLSELEIGNKEMGVRTLERLANALGVSAAQLADCKTASFSPQFPKGFCNQGICDSLDRHSLLGPGYEG